MDPQPCTLSSGRLRWQDAPPQQGLKSSSYNYTILPYGKCVSQCLQVHRLMQSVFLHLKRPSTTSLINIYNKFYNKPLEPSWKRTFLRSWCEVGMCHTGLPLAQDNSFMDILALLRGPGGTQKPAVVDAACWTYRGFVLMEM